MTFIQESVDVPLKVTHMEWVWFKAVLDERVRGLNHETDIIFRTYIEAEMIKVCDVKGSRRQSVPA